MRLTILTCFVVGTLSLAAQSNEDVLRPNGRPDDQQHQGKRNRAFVLGIEGGVNINMLSQGLSYSPNQPVPNSPESVLGSGTGISPELGLFADVRIAPRLGLQFRVAYDAKSASNTMSDGIVEGTIVQEGTVDGGTPYTEGTVESHYSIAMSAVSLGILARVNIAPNLFATVGPIANIAMGDVTRTDRLTVKEPEDFNILVDYEGVPGMYKEVTRETTVSQNMLPAVGAGNYEGSTYSTSRIGLEIGLGYRFPLSNTVYLAPNIRYQYFFTQLTAGYNSQDISHFYSQGEVPMTFSPAKLNSLALIVQLGFSL